jgi:hypothetical protein
MMPTLIIEKRKAAEKGKWVKDSAEPWRESCNYYWRIGRLNELPAPENPFHRACALAISAIIMYWVNPVPKSSGPFFGHKKTGPLRAPSRLQHLLLVIDQPSGLSS